MNELNNSMDTVPANCLIIVCSYHHNNTMKIAEEISKIIGANVDDAYFLNMSIA